MLCQQSLNICIQERDYSEAIKKWQKSRDVIHGDDLLGDVKKLNGNKAYIKVTDNDVISLNLLNLR